MSTPTITRCTSSELFERLHALPSSNQVTLELLQLFSLGQAVTDLAVALDFLEEQQLCAASTLRILRGDDPPRSWVHPTLNLEMVWISPGEFRYGKDGNRRHSTGFFLARHPITVQQWNLFTSATAYDFPAENGEGVDFNNLQQANALHPAVGLSLLDGLQFCQWAGLQVPTEYQWEYAARGSDGRTYPWGDEPPNVRLAWFAHQQPTSVGSFSHVRSAFGCEDMSGNVSEWCLPQDVDTEWVRSTDILFQKDSLPELAQVRGGCFLRRTRAVLSTHARRNLSPLRRNRWVGLRPAFVPLNSLQQVS